MKRIALRLSLAVILLLVAIAAVPQAGAATGVKLWEGWNLVTYTGVDGPSDVITSSISSPLQSVWWHDNQTKDWFFYSPKVPMHVNTLTMLQRYQPYWVHVAGDTFWPMGT